MLVLKNNLDAGEVVDEHYASLTIDLKRISLVDFLNADGNPRHFQKSVVSPLNPASVLKDMLKYVFNRIFEKHGREPCFRVPLQKSVARQMFAEYPVQFFSLRSIRRSN